MRTRQAQQLQADVYALLDEAVGVNAGGYATGVKPAPADLLEFLNQQWADVYGLMIQSGITWNMQTSTFQTFSGVDTYGLGAGAWSGGITSVTVLAGGTGYTNGTPFTFSNPTTTGTPATGTLIVSGGAVTGVNITSPGSGYIASSSTTGAGGTGANIRGNPTGTYWKTMGVDVQVTPGFWRPANRFQFEQRDQYQMQQWAWPEPILYDIWGGTSDSLGVDGTLLKLIPAPQGSYQMRHYWFPAPQRLIQSTDVFDGVAGAERAIVYGAAQEAAIMLEQFEQADRFAQLRDAKVQRIISTMRDRISGEAPMARVVRGRPTLWRQRGGGTGRWNG